MSGYSLAFFILAASTGLLGFSSRAGGVGYMLQVLFFLFVSIWAVLLLLACGGSGKRRVRRRASSHHERTVNH